MNSKQVAEWKADRQRRVQEMKDRLLAMPEPSEESKRKGEWFGKFVVQAKAHRDRYGWQEGS